MDAAATPLFGGCLCGQLRYRIRHVRGAFWCHCHMCRRASGSGALPWASVGREDIAFIQGTPARYDSSPGVTRLFCGRCGSPLVFDMAREEDVDVTIGTLDNPDSLVPTHHIWTQSALACTSGLGAGLPRHAGEVEAEAER